MVVVGVRSDEMEKREKETRDMGLCVFEKFDNNFQAHKTKRNDWLGRDESVTRNIMWSVGSWKSEAKNKTKKKWK